MKIYTRSLLAILITALFFIGGCGMVSDKLGSNVNSGNSPPPTLSSTTPTLGAKNIAINGKIIGTFGQAMDPATITAKSFILKQGSTTIPCTVELAGMTATLTPQNKLSVNTPYTATITTEAKDIYSN